MYDTNLLFFEQKKFFIYVFLENNFNIATNLGASQLRTVTIGPFISTWCLE